MILRLGGHASRAIRSRALQQTPRSSVKQNRDPAKINASLRVTIRAQAVRFENSKTILNADSATAMGEYYFTTLEGTVAKVEYTFQYKRGADGALKIVVHHSSLPYSP